MYDRAEKPHPLVCEQCGTAHPDDVVCRLASRPYRETCSGCKHWESIPNSFNPDGLCKAQPPRPTGSGAAQWPKTQAGTGACGGYTAKGVRVRPRTRTP